MIKVGITGGIGSGKSTVCKVFSALYDIPVYNSDDRAKYLMEYDGDIKNKLSEKFGIQLYNEGKLNRKYLAEIIFNDTLALQYVNSIVHPAVGRDYLLWLSNSDKYSYTLKEAALLFESGAYKQLDYLITVSCPEELRIRRVMLRDNVSYEKVLERMRNQWSDEEKIKQSNFIIINDDNNSIIEQVISIHTQIINKK